MALGRTRLLFWVSFVYALVHLPAFIAGTALFGLAGSIWSIVVAGVLYSYLNTWLLKRTLGLSLHEIGSQLRRPVACGGGHGRRRVGRRRGDTARALLGEWLLAVARDEDPGRRRSCFDRPVRALATRGPPSRNRAALASDDVPIARPRLPSSVFAESSDSLSAPRRPKVASTPMCQ